MRALRPALSPFAFALCAYLQACSQSSSHPLAVGDCQGPPASCGAGPTVQGGVAQPPGGSTPDAAEGAAGRACGTLTRPDALCEACLEQSCCTPAIICSNNAECAALTQCLGLCQPTDPPCISICQNTHMVGQPNYNDFVLCLRTNCTVSCQIGDAGTNCGNLVFSSAACDTCVGASCCSAAAVCTNDPDCILLAQCLQVCQPNDTNCIASCQNTSPNGVGVYAALAQCIQANCVSQCQ